MNKEVAKGLQFPVSLRPWQGKHLMSPVAKTIVKPQHEASLRGAFDLPGGQSHVPGRQGQTVNPS